MSLACWGQDASDFLADCWKEKAIISCHFRARKCSTITPERSNPRSVSLSRPPWNKFPNWHCWGKGWKRRETNSPTESGMKACELQVNSGLNIMRQARDGPGLLSVGGPIETKQDFFPGFSRTVCMFPKRICSISVGLLVYVCGNVHR